jgi:hypothetical protein
VNGKCGPGTPPHAIALGQLESNETPMAVAGAGGSSPALSVMVVDDKPQFRELFTDIDLGGGMSGVE